MKFIKVFLIIICVIPMIYVGAKALVMHAGDSAIVLYSQEEPATFFGESANGTRYSEGDVVVHVLGVEMVNLTDVQLTQEYRDALFMQDIPDEEVQLLTIDLGLTNTTEAEIRLPLYEFVAESGAWSTACPKELFELVNPDQRIESVSLLPMVEEKTTLVFPIYKAQFQQTKTWDELISRQYYLVLKNYPTKQMITLSINP